MALAEAPRLSESLAVVRTSYQERRSRWQKDWIDFLGSEGIYIASSRYIDANTELEEYTITHQKICVRPPIFSPYITADKERRILDRLDKKNEAQRAFNAQKEEWVLQDSERVLFYTLERPERKEELFARFAAARENPAQTVQGLENEYNNLIEQKNLVEVNSS
jgi:hypothetical protein